MSAERFLLSLHRLGMTQASISLFFQVSIRTVQRWATGELPIPRSVELCLLVMEKTNLMPDQLENYIADVR
jgi:DNA-binding transcriptional regulator YiaG